jgi:D-serine deaminase-like pyridoxal phosphate-dependent protein
MIKIQSDLVINLSKLHQQISTPALLVDAGQMQTNLTGMQLWANKHDVNLRPHIKTHKSIDFAQKQIAMGAKGLSVAKLSEAQKMASAGIDDIFIANQIAQPTKIKDLHHLHEKINLITGMDHEWHIDVLKKEFTDCSKPLSVRIEIDSGFGRCGILPEDGRLVELARHISQKKWLKLEGLFTHAGQSYSAKSSIEISQIARKEAVDILKAKEVLALNGIEIATISVGSTPTAREVITIPGITEARPGNYIFYDGVQQALGSCKLDQCSLFVLATVISQPEENKIVCDAGSKALNLDRGAHSSQILDGFGTVLNIDGKIKSLSEEHGIIILDKPETIKIGSPVLIIPNHACVVANLYDRYHVVDKNLSVQTVPISCRGLSQ